MSVQPLRTTPEKAVDQDTNDDLGDNKRTGKCIKKVFVLCIGGYDTVINPTPDGTSGHRIHIDQLHRVSAENGIRSRRTWINKSKLRRDTRPSHRRIPGY